jgi:superfamily II DNA/RNA helicase
VIYSRDDVITSLYCYLTCVHRVHHQQTLKAGGYPEIRAALCTGGESNQTMVDTYNRRGLHCIVATPGRLNDHLNKKRINMDICKYFVLDEGDRMLDLGFDEEVRGACVGVKWCYCVLLCAVV